MLSVLYTYIVCLISKLASSLPSYMCMYMHVQRDHDCIIHPRLTVCYWGCPTLAIHVVQHKCWNRWSGKINVFIWSALCFQHHLENVIVVQSPAKYGNKKAAVLVLSICSTTCWAFVMDYLQQQCNHCLYSDNSNVRDCNLL